jgi:hypothetical protein
MKLLLSFFLISFNLFAYSGIFTDDIHNKYSKLQLPNYSLLPGTVAQFNPFTGTIESASTSTVELAALQGINGNIQDQIDNIIGGGGFEPSITPGTTLQYWRGDKTFQTLNTNVVPDFLNKRYVTDAEKTKLANLSGVNTGDQDLSSYATSASVSSALSLKYDASNPNGYETPSQLNARDTANRSRSNHTGTQTASTISDFNASAQTALSASLALKYDASNPANYITTASVSSALNLKEDVAPAYVNFYFLSTYTGTPTGSYSHPFNNLTTAISTAFASGANAQIKILDRAYTLPSTLTINNYNANLTIEGAGGANDSVSTSVTGDIIISGTSTRIRFKNLKLNGNLTLDGCDGRIYTDNFEVNNITFSNAWKRWYEFHKTSILGTVTIGGSPASSPQISTFDLRGSSTWAINSNVTVLHYFPLALNSITHSNGNLFIRGGGGFTNATGITSTANTPNFFIIDGTSFYQGAGVYSLINKTGTADYFLDAPKRNFASDVLTGSRIGYGINSADLGYTPTTSGEWLSPPTNIRGALDSIANESVKDFVNVTGSSYSIVDNVKYVKVNFAGTSTVTLPSAIGRKGKSFHIKVLTANDVNIATVSGQLIDGAASPAILNGINNSAMLTSDGANWFLN